MKNPAGTLDIRLNVKIKSSPKKIYRALTSARLLCRWWLEGAETDAKNMGHLRLVWPKIKTGDGNIKRAFPAHVAKGEAKGFFVDLEPEKKIAWIWELAPKRRYPPLSTFFIEVRGRLSEVTLVQCGFSNRPNARKYFEGARSGWEDCLAKLKLYLETGKTLKSQVLILGSAKTPLKTR
jgi:uncharacterized protein YndB with AHSA1/START domain